MLQVPHITPRTPMLKKYAMCHCHAYRDAAASIAPASLNVFGLDMTIWTG
jgi:hypothetical protein